MAPRKKSAASAADEAPATAPRRSSRIKKVTVRAAEAAEPEEAGVKREDDGGVGEDDEEVEMERPKASSRARKPPAKKTAPMRRAVAAADEDEDEDDDDGARSRPKKAKAETPVEKVARGQVMAPSEAAWQKHWTPKPAGFNDRAVRALSQRMYLIDRADVGSSSRFSVFGASGTTYRVNIGNEPSCTCPDAAFRARSICKHRTFVMVRVLHVPQNSPLLYQHQLTDDEVDGLLRAPAGRALAGDVLAPTAVRQTFAAVTGSTLNLDASGAAAAPVVAAIARPIAMGDECAICYEEFAAEKIEKIVACASCGNNLHGVCITKWQQAKAGVTTCPLCRGAFKGPAAQGGAAWASGPRRNLNLQNTLNEADEAAEGDY